MREVVFASMPGIGPGVGPLRRGSLADLAMAIPYLVLDEIPPRQVLNDMLTRGFDDAGMSGGCIWEPLELDDNEYAELLDALQRRGTRPVAGRDPGGKPYVVPAVPASVRTYGEWVAYRADHRNRSNPEGQRRMIEDEKAKHPADGRYERWLDWLPVGELYLSYVKGREPDWKKHSNDDAMLPRELVALLQRLESTHRAWSEGKRDLAHEADAVRVAIREYVDASGLPRWPGRLAVF